jgi:hypothetical protein
MDGFQSYFASDPEFDGSKRMAAGVCPPCPPVTTESLTRAFSFAIAADFKGIEEIGVRERSMLPRKVLERISAPKLRSTNDSTRTEDFDFGGGEKIRQCAGESAESYTESHPGGIRLSLTGSGGGVWKISRRADCCEIELPDETSETWPLIYGSSQVFQAWLDGEFSFETGLRNGLLILADSEQEWKAVDRILNLLRVQIIRSINEQESTLEQSDVVTREFATVGNES